MTHIVTLIGPGGMGKSRLALRAGHALRRHFPDGVWVVELAELDDADELADELARALQVYEQPEAPIEDVLVRSLQDRRLLLVFDDCDALLEASGELASSIVTRCPGVRVLCTSQRRLGVPGEAVVSLSPLEVPTSSEGYSSALENVEALKLLAERAAAVAPDFALTEENGAAAVEICRRLDGLPLAIELAAVRLQSMTAGDLLDRLDDRLRLLTYGRGRHLERHRALRATVEWNHELLGAEERILWRRLSVFSGSFGIDAAEVVCSGGELQRDRIVDALGHLVDSSILTMAQSEHRGRYRLLETMRVYGAERLRESGEETELHRRHATWCAGLLAPDGRPWWHTGGQADLIDLLDVEWPNVEAALDFCARSPVDSPLGMRMAAEAWPYWVVRGRYGMGRRRLEAYLDLLPEPNPARAMALWSVGFLAQATADHDAALAALEEAREIGVQTGADREIAYSLIGLALVRLRVGVEAAVELLVAARETLLALDDPAQSLCLYYLATALAAGGQTTDALERAREGLEVDGLESDTIMRSLLDTLLGTLHWMLGDPVAAETALKRAVRVQQRLGHRFGLANSLDGLAWVAASAGSFERAALLLGAVASLWEELGIVPVPFWQSHRDACEAAVRDGLIEATYEKCWNQGFVLGREEQVALARDEALPSPKHARETQPSDSFELSARELEVARLVAGGLSNPAIAATLFLSVATVKTHVSHILRKLALDSRVQLASWLAAHDPGAATADR